MTLTPISGDQLAAATPVQIDSRLADIWRRHYKVLDEVDDKRAYRKDYASRLAAVDAGTYRYSYTASERARDEAGVARMDAAIAELLEQAATIAAEADPYEAEFDRRGGWTRAFLVVTNGRGHVHATRACTTCYPTTRFRWLVQYSGATEAQVVADARAGACTVCYPSAPVELRNQPCLIEDPDTAAVRREREETRARKAAEAQAKAIANPDGSPLRTRYSGAIRTERTAQIEYVDLAARTRWARTAGHISATLLASYEADLRALSAALAHKRGITAGELEQSLAAKVDKKFRAEYAH